MGWHPNDRGTVLNFHNPRSPKYRRKKPTKRQKTVLKRGQANCPCSLSTRMMSNPGAPEHNMCVACGKKHDT